MPSQEEDDQIAMTWNDPFNNAYKKLFFNKAGTKLLGGILVGDASDYTTLLVSLTDKYLTPKVALRTISNLRGTGNMLAVSHLSASSLALLRHGV